MNGFGVQGVSTPAGIAPGTNCITKTYAEATTLRTASGLKCGVMYYLSDKDVYLIATAVNRFGANGWFLDTSLATSEVDAIIYDFVNDHIEERKDRRGNIVQQLRGINGALGSYPIDTFPWGDDKVFNNHIRNSILSVAYGAGVDANTTFTNNRLDFLTILTLTGYEGKILGLNAVQSTLTFTNITVNGANNHITGCKFTGCTVNMTRSGNGAIFSGGFYRNSLITANAVANQILLTNVNMDTSSLDVLGNATGTIDTANITNGSNFTCTDFTGTINVLGITQASSVDIVGGNATMTNVFCHESSTIEWTLIDSTATISTLKVSHDSTLELITADQSGQLSNIIITDTSNVTIDSNTANQSSWLIQNRTVTIDGTQAHASLHINGGQSNWVKNIDATDTGEFTAGGFIVTDSTTDHHYTGRYIINEISNNGGSPTVVNGAVTGGVWPSGQVFRVEAGNGAVGEPSFIQLTDVGTESGITDADFAMTTATADIANHSLSGAGTDIIEFEVNANNIAKEISRNIYTT